MAKSAPKNHKASDTSFDAVLRLGEVAPQAPANLRDGLFLGLQLNTDGNALDALVFLTDPQPIRAVAARVCSVRDPLLEEIGRQLRDWFANPAHAFSLPLGHARTLFQERLRSALCNTRRGQTLTYAELAKQLHSAPRAVGQALGSNPLPLIVPCHRIISAGKNRLTGFNHASDGPMLTLKAWLLERESHA